MSLNLVFYHALDLCLERRILLLNFPSKVLFDRFCRFSDLIYNFHAEFLSYFVDLFCNGISHCLKSLAQHSTFIFHAINFLRKCFSRFIYIFFFLWFLFFWIFELQDSDSLVKFKNFLIQSESFFRPIIRSSCSLHIAWVFRRWRRMCLLLLLLVVVVELSVRPLLPLLFWERWLICAHMPAWQSTSRLNGLSAVDLNRATLTLLFYNHWRFYYSLAISHILKSTLASWLN